MKKLPTLLHRCSDFDLDIIAVQEIGDPALLLTRLPHYQFIYSAGPSRHEAGVGLLLSHRLLPRCRSYKQSTTSRLAAAVLEHEHGKKTLVVSAYMPAGLDHSSPTSDKVTRAHALYTEINEWSRGMHQVIVMGDLNETLTPSDRQPSTAVHSSSTSLSPIHSLLASGFIDAYRHLHPLTPGFTHVIDSALRPSSSRLDYVWLKGFSIASIHSAVVDKHHSLQRLSHHRLLLVTVSTHHTLHTSTHKAPSRPQLPNLRAATEADKLRFVQHLEAKLQRVEHKLCRHASAAAGGSHVRENIDLLAAILTSITSRQAQAHLPLSASNPYRSRAVSELERQRAALSRLLHAVRLLLSAGYLTSAASQQPRGHATPVSLLQTLRHRVEQQHQPRHRCLAAGDCTAHSSDPQLYACSVRVSAKTTRHTLHQVTSSSCPSHAAERCTASSYSLRCHSRRSSHTDRHRVTGVYGFALRAGVLCPSSSCS